MTPLLPRGKKKAGDRVVTLIGKPGCHLCDDARSVLERVCAETGAAFEEKDITRDEELHRAYWEQIPVVLVDGEQHTFWRVDAARLRRELGA
ncbi:glutaredoxin family protein [Streptomyces sp. PKU-MA01144]|uniref:glutaredoxin family protein n=1 Tax=Streptomyces TaxID=1883 RepID=UPI00147F4DAD|nr:MULTISPECIES: glutaredoxin family protein [Streptomyces]MCY0984408.1 glutaredoxin family protein [Streptomyces tirandamycinicus]NNJ03960.1 glutaredoxin family protein [Streptomyces sp. PKU-MA01144]